MKTKSQFHAREAVRKRLKYAVGGIWIVALAISAALTAASSPVRADEAKSGFKNQSNGFTSQKAFNRDRKAFEETEAIDDGLGPVYNATSCVSCHQNPVTGSSSQVSEIRAGHVKKDRDGNPIEFVEPPGGSLIHQRATNAAAQEHVRPQDETRTLRMSNTLMG